MRIIQTKKAKRELAEGMKRLYAGTPTQEGKQWGATLTFEELLEMDRDDKPQASTNTSRKNRKGRSPERSKGNGRR
jgi:hypothetical protein